MKLYLKLKTTYGKREYLISETRQDVRMQDGFLRFYTEGGSAMMINADMIKEVELTWLD
jgi:hypothetical protein